MDTKKEHPDPGIGLLDDGTLNVVSSADPFEDDDLFDDDDEDGDETRDATRVPRTRKIVIHR